MAAMIGTAAPVLQLRLGDARDIPDIVRAVTGPWGLAKPDLRLPDKSVGLIAAALAEVLRSIFGLPGSPEREGTAVELWIEPALAVVALRFAGPPLPDWMVVNWDRGEPPAVIAPPGDSAWGWLTVREALDSVVQLPGRGGNLLLLERLL